MSTTARREFASICVIVVAVCIGAWMIVVEPMATELGRLEAEIARSEAAASRFTESMVAQMTEELTDVRGHLAEIRQRNELAADSAELYASIKSMAAEHGVEFRRHNLRDLRADSASGGATAVSLNLEVTGEYIEVAMFLQSVVELDGYLRVNSLALSPTTEDDQFLVTAVMVCEALAFPIPEALARLQGDLDGDS